MREIEKSGLHNVNTEKEGNAWGLLPSVENDTENKRISVSAAVSLSELEGFASCCGASLCEVVACAFAYTVSRYAGSSSADVRLLCYAKEEPDNLSEHSLSFDCGDASCEEFVANSSSAARAKIVEAASVAALGGGELPSVALAVVGDSASAELFSLDKLAASGVQGVDLCLVAQPQKAACRVTIYHSGFFSNDFCSSFSGAFLRILQQLPACQKLSQIEYTSSQEIACLDAWNATEKELPVSDVIEALNATLEATPENTLVTYKELGLTYAQGAFAVNALSQALLDAGLGCGEFGAILVPRSQWYLLCSLAVLARGAVCVPVDEDYPDERVLFMLEDTKAKVVLVTNETAARAQFLAQQLQTSPALVNVDSIEVEGRSERIVYEPVPSSSIAYVFYTSGTTGRPKGVLQTRLGILNICSWQVDLMSITANDVYAMYPSFGFDSHIQAFFSATMVGAAVDITPQEVRLDIDALAKQYSQRGVTLVKMTTPVGRLFVEHVTESTVRMAYLSGEKLGEVNKKNDITVFDGYGPTENTLQTAAIDYERKIDTSSVGRPHDNVKAYVLDAEGRRVPPGAIGSLYLSGYQLAAGYLNRPKESQSAFLDNPFDAMEPGYERMYATGDVARWLPDGTLGFLGRRDSQVKVRGNRVELSEVAACIREMEGVRDVAVVAMESGASKELVAYVVADAEAYAAASGPLADLVRLHVGAQKPAYMVPAFVVELPEIPLTVNGKVDRRALPVPDTASLRAAYARPETPLQSKLVEAFAETLGVDGLGIDDDFVALGGDSLAAIRLLSLVPGTGITAANVLSLKTPRAIAKAAEGSQGPEVQWDRFSLGDALPLTEPQLNVYLDAAVGDKQGTYLIRRAFDIPARYGAKDILYALQQLVLAHPVLAAKVEDTPQGPVLMPGEMPRIALDEDLEAFLKADLDLSVCTCRFLVRQQGRIAASSLDSAFPESHGATVYGVFSHVVFDGVSAFALEKSLKALLSGEGLSTDVAFLRAAAFARQLNGSVFLEQGRAFFADMLAQADEVPSLLSDATGGQAGLSSCELSVSAAELSSYCRACGVGEGAVLAAAFGYALSRFSGGERALFNIVVNGRDRYGAKDAVGMFAATLPVLLDCSDAALHEFFQRAAERIYGAMDYDYYPFRNLAREFGIDIQILFQYMPDSSNATGGYEVGHTPGLVNDLSVAVVQEGERLVAQMEHSACYGQQTIAGLAHVFDAVLKQALACERLSQIEYLDANSAALQDSANATDARFEYEDILDAFAHHVACGPQNPLVTCGDECLTYAEGAAKAAAVRASLAAKGVGAGDNVGILVPRSQDYVTCALGVLACGSAYVPVDDTLPDERVQLMLEDSGAVAVLATAGTRERALRLANSLDKQITVLDVDSLLAASSDSAMAFGSVKVGADAPACILYTSGTTGRPKGVVVTRRAIANHSQFCANRISLEPSQTFGLYASFSFDAHIKSVYTPIAAGACVDVVPNEVRLDVDALASYIEHAGMEYIFITTQVAKLYMDAYPHSCLRALFVGGEALGEVPQGLGYAVLDAYGPTETCVFVGLANAVEKIAPESIGKPNANTRFYVLDAQGRRVPVGAVGELCVSGWQLAAGYLNRPEATAAVFTANPFLAEPGFERLYHTGDMARWLSDGTVGYLGRRDAQVKIRGNRVELGEVEAALRSCPGVKDCTVVAARVGGGKELAAYVVADKGSKTADLPRRVKAWVEKERPAYMVPAFVTLLSAIPLTSNGKVDKRALPAPNMAELRATYEAPRTPAEKAVANVLGRVLGVERLGLDDDFLQLGGDSIKAIRIVSLLRQAGVSCRAQDVLQLRTARKLASLAEAALAKTPAYAHVSGPVPLLPIQSYFFDFEGRNDFVQAFAVRALRALDAQTLQGALDAVTDTHDMLRAVYSWSEAGRPEQTVRPVGQQSCVLRRVKASFDDGTVDEVLKEVAEQGCSFLDISAGRLMDAALVEGDGETYVVLVVHHLVVDGVSWAILLDDLTTAYEHIERGEDANLEVPLPYAEWVAHTQALCASMDESEKEHWTALGKLLEQEQAKPGSAQRFSFGIEGGLPSQNVLQLTEEQFLLLALSRAWRQVFGCDLLCDLESHGRDASLADASRTVGWFTNIYPSLFSVETSNAPVSLVKSANSIKESLCRVEHLGAGYMALAFEEGGIEFVPAPVTFNYLSSEFAYASSLFSSAGISVVAPGQRNETCYGVTFNITKEETGGFLVRGAYSPTDPKAARLNELLKAFVDQAALIASVEQSMRASGTYVCLLTEPQLGVFLDETTHQKQTAYSCFGSVRCSIGTDSVRARAAVEELVSRHPVLRSRVEVDDGTPLLVCDVNLEAQTVDAGERGLDEVFSNLVKPFDLQERLARFWVVERGPEVVIAYDLHHIIGDATTRSLLNAELGQALNGEKLYGIDLGFLQASAEEIKVRCSHEYRQAQDFYNRLLCDFGEIAGLEDDIEGCAGSVTIPLSGMASAVESFAQQHAATPAAVLASAFAYTLSRFTGCSDVCFCINEHGRSHEWAQRAAGMLVRTVPLVIDCAEQPVDDFVSSAAKTVFDAMEASIYPYRLLAAQYGVNNGVSFEYNADLNDVSRLETNCMSEVLYGADGRVPVNDLLGEVNVVEGGYLVTFEHSDRFSQDTVRRFAQAYEAVLSQLLSCRRLADIDCVNPQDLAFQDSRNQTAHGLDHADVLDIFNEDVANAPQAPLVSSGDTRLSYSQSAAAAACIADMLVKAGAEPNDRVAILVPRSHWYLLCALGILACGAAYVPIDDDYPNDRALFMMEDAGVKAVLATGQTWERARLLSSQVPGAPAVLDVEPCLGNQQDCGLEILSEGPWCKVGLDAVACVLYTSGTTGKPKGVLVPRRAVLNMGEWYARATGMTSTDVYGMYVSYVFDMHTLAFYGTIAAGASVDIVPREKRLDLQLLNEHFVSRGCTHTYITSQVGKLFAQSGMDTTIRLLCFGGMKLGELKAPDAIGPFESYGPSENLAISTSIFANERCHHSSVGRFNSNTKGYVLDAELRRVPCGAVGELYLSGYQLAQGYLNRPVENASAFLQNPFDGDAPGYERMYKTGDVVRWLPDGTLGIIGRRDAQVKIRGNRVELGEVETAVRNAEYVRDVTVVAIDTDAGKELAAYVVLEDPHDPKIDEAVVLTEAVASHVRASRPSYMIPAFVIRLEAIPLNVNGKVDKRALPAPDLDALRAGYIAPRTALEHKVAQAFGDVLGLSVVGIDDDFLRLGGDSLAAVRVLTALEDVPVTAADILSLKTPRAIAAATTRAEALQIDWESFSLEGPLPLTESQLNVYLDIRANGKEKAYTITTSVAVPPAYTADQAEEALYRVLDAHPVLGRHVEDSSSGPELVTGRRPMVFLQYISGVAKSTAIEAFYASGLELHNTLSRFLIVDDGEHVTVYAAFHHIIFDGLSIGVFKRHFLTALEGSELRLDTTFAKAVAFGQGVQGNEVWSKAERFFDSMLSEAGEVPELLPSVGDNEKGNASKELSCGSQALSDLCGRFGVGAGTLLAAVFAYAFTRFTGDDRALFNVVENGRDHLDAADAIGMFVSTLPVLIDCSDARAEEFVGRAANVVYKAMSYDFYPFRLLAKQNGVNSSVLFQFRPGATGDASEPGVANEGEQTTPEGLISDLSVTVSQSGQALYLSIEHSESYSKQLVERLMQVFNAVLSQISSCGRMGDIQYTGADDLRLQDSWNNTALALRNSDILEAFDASLKEHPDNLLVQFENERLTYGQGALVACGVRDTLNAAGVMPGDHVAVFVPRSQWYLLGALGILACGAAYVPIDEAHPDERIRFILEDTKVSAILVTPQTADRVQDLCKGMTPAPVLVDVSTCKASCQDACAPFLSSKDASPRSTACIIYTSGTTGRPKGVLVPRLALINLAEWYGHETGFAMGDIYSLHTSYAFDMHTLGMFAPVVCAAAVDIVPSQTRLSVEGLQQHFEQAGTTHTFITTQLAKLFVTEVESPAVNVLYAAGEALREVNTGDFKGMYDGYGPCENLALSTSVRVGERIHPTSVGKLNSNSKGYVLDAQRRRVPCGAVGELYLSGYQLAAGYLNRPVETSAAFWGNPFDGHLEGFERMYATGDMVRWLPDGTLGFVGRRDSQVKVRGNRVELAEVEAALRGMPFVADATVVVASNGQANELVAYVTLVPDHDEALDEAAVLAEEVSNRILASKPNYMVPAFVIALDAIPLNVNGKVDKHALPAPDFTLLASSYAEPATQAQRRCALCMAQVLGLESVGADDDFVRLGGDSLSAIRLLSLLDGMDVTVADILALKTPRAIAAAASASDLEGLDWHSCSPGTALPLTESQLNIYLDIQAKGKVGTYLIKGDVPVPAGYSLGEVAAALKALMAVHPVLSCHVEDTANGPMLVPGPAPEAQTLSEEDSNAFEDALAAFLARPLQPKLSLCRFLIAKKGMEAASRITVYGVFHHLAFDGMSFPVFKKHLLEILEGNRLAVDTAYARAASFSQWVSQSRLFNRAAAFFQNSLEGAQDVPGLIPDAVGGMAARASYKLSVPEKQVAAFARHNGMGQGAVFTAAFAYTLSRFTGGEQALFNIVVNGRDRFSAQHAVGMFVNTLPVLVDCTDAEVEAFVAQAADAIYGTMTYDFYPFRLLSKEYGVEAGILFQFRPDDAIGVGDPGVAELNEVEPLGSKDLISDLSVAVVQSKGSYMVEVEHSAKYSPDTIGRLVSALDAVVRQMSTCLRMAQIEYADAHDLALQEASNNTDTAFEYADILEAFAAHTDSNPQSLLVASDDSCLSYEQGKNVVASIASALRSKGVGAGDNVAVVVPRGCWYLTCSLAVMACGAAYVPVDCALPDERIQLMLQDAAVDAVLVTQETEGRVLKIEASLSTTPATVKVDALAASENGATLVAEPSTPETPACILYTSGTTGRPKGVVVTRGAIANHSQFCAEQIQMRPGERFGLYASFSFDAHIKSLYTPVAAGACCDVIPDEIRLDVDGLNAYINRAAMEYVFITTQVAKVYMDKHPQSSLKALFVGGEKLGEVPSDLGYQVLDAYGPTETCVFVGLANAAQKTAPESIGRPNANTRFYILDAQGRRVPVGAVGELCVSGRQLAAGYLGRPQETAAAFVPNPYANGSAAYARLYKTGDVARWLPDGTVGYLGRRDAQVKIRGNRVELGEVEAAVRDVAGVADCTVQAVQMGTGKELAAYVVAAPETAGDEDMLPLSVQEHVRRNRPAYMVPAFVVMLNAIPLTANGKVDKRALPAPDKSALRAAYVPPVTEEQKRIAEGFAAVLGLERVGLDDDFVRLGGDSLSAIKLLPLLRGLSITAAEVLSLKTPRALEKVAKRAVFESVDWDLYGLEGPVPLTEPQLNVYLDLQANEKQGAYLIRQSIVVAPGYSADQVRAALVKVLHAHPVLTMHVADTDLGPALMPNSQSVWEKSVLLQSSLDVSLDPKVSLCGFELEQSDDRGFVLRGVFHHIAFDGMSLPVFERDFQAALRGKELRLDNAFVKAASFAQWVENEPVNRQAQRFFADLLADAHEIVGLLPSSQGRAGSVSKALATNDEQLAAACRAFGVGKGTLLAAVFAYVLSRFTGDERVLFNVVVNGRDRLGAADAVGMFAATLPVVVGCEDADVDTFVRDASDVLYKAMSFDFYPFRILARDYGVKASVLFQYQPEANDAPGSDNAQSSAGLIADLSAAIVQRGDVCYFEADHSSAYSQELMERFAQAFDAVLMQMLSCQRLAEIVCASSEDLLLQKQWNATESPLVYQDVLQAFDAAVLQWPQNTLVSFAEDEYSYCHVAGIVGELAAQLSALGATPGKDVAILVERSPWYLLGALAVLSCGAAYVPLDDALPDERLRVMLKDAGPAVILATRVMAHRASELASECSADLVLVDLEAGGLKVESQGEVLPRLLDPDCELTPSLASASIDSASTACVLYTSGTTGVPKGVRITRRALANYAQWDAGFAPACQTDVYGLYTSFGFDAHIKPLYTPFVSGASLRVIPSEIRLDMEALNSFIQEHGITHLFLTTQIAKAFVSQNAKTTLKVLFLGGEPVGGFRGSDMCRMINGYGPTENTVFSTTVDLCNMEDDSSLGHLNCNTKGYVLDAQGHLLPVGAVGELYLSGYQLAGGYLNRPKETEAAFSSNPFDGDVQGYERMYRTGDMVRWTQDGALQIMGRRDSQVKVRGNRVELGEVEAVLRQVAFVADCTVVAVNALGTKELAAYLVLTEDAPSALVSQAALADYIRAQVRSLKPDYMVPSYVTALPRIPLNVNGKVDKRALPQPSASGKRDSFVAPQTHAEHVIAQAFETVLGISQVGVEDNFISLGGDSLSAVRLLPLVKGLHITAAEVLSLGTPRALANAAEETLLNEAEWNRFSLGERLPLTEPQLNVFLDMQANSKPDAYVITHSISLPSELRDEQIVAALEQVLAAHPILGMHAEEGNEGPVLVVNSKHEHAALLEQGAIAPAGLNPAESLCRFALERKASGSLMLKAAFHHIAFDGMSIPVFENSFERALKGEELQTDNAFVRAASFASWVQEGPLFAKAADFYNHMLSEAGEVASLPACGNSEGASIMRIPLQVTQEQIGQLCHRFRVGAGGVLTAAFAYVLSRFTGDERALFGIVSNGRDRFAAENAVGMFATTLPLLLDCSGAKVEDYVSQVSNAVYQAMYYDFYPFRILAREHGVNADILFQYRPGISASQPQAAEEEPLGNGAVVCDLSFAVLEQDSFLTLEIERSSKYSSKLVRRIAATFQSVLAQMTACEDLASIAYTSPDEVAQLDSWNATEMPLSHNSVYGAFCESAARVPSEPMVSYGDVTLSYSQGKAQVDAIARKLTDAGVNPGDTVGILVPRSQWYLLGSLAVLACGATFVPLDDALPDERLSFMLKDSGAQVLLAASQTGARAQSMTSCVQTPVKVVLADENATDVTSLASLASSFEAESEVACVLYTSGTTGTPKGVLVTGLAALNMCEHYIHMSGLSQKDSYGMFSAFGFDAAVLAMFPPMLVGACVDVVPEDCRLSIDRLNAHFCEQGVTHTMLTTRLAKLFAESVETTTLEFLLAGGEALGETSPKGDYAFWDGYGPTECCAFVASAAVEEKSEALSVGHLSSNMKAYVLDAQGRRVPIGSVGELCLSGYQVAAGYLNRPAETAAAFTDNPFDGASKGYERMYHTGDMVRMLEDGSLSYVGRRDTQVKIRGNRVETSEVEDALRALEGIEDAAVVVMGSKASKELVAYVVLTPGGELAGLDKAQLGNGIKVQIGLSKPSYMVPAFVVEVPVIPLNVNGKVDRRALPAVDRASWDGGYVAPVEESELKATACMAHVLGVDKEIVGLDTSFVSLGGDSLLAVALSHLYKTSLGLDILAVDILRNPTIRQQLALARNPQALRDITELSPGGADGLKLVFVHPGQGGSESYQNLAKALPKEVGLACLEHCYYNHRVEESLGVQGIARRYVDALQQWQPCGPYLLGGWSYGGNVAYEMACILAERGERVDNVFLLDAQCFDEVFEPDEVEELVQARIGELLAKHAEEELNVDTAAARMVYKDLYEYTPSAYAGRVTYLRATQQASSPDILSEHSANRYMEAAEAVKVCDIDTLHDAMMEPQVARMVAEVIVNELSQTKEP